MLQVNGNYQNPGNEEGFLFLFSLGCPVRKQPEEGAISSPAELDPVLLYNMFYLNSNRMEENHEGEHVTPSCFLWIII